MHVVCYHLLEHFISAKVKPHCVLRNCKKCGRQIHLCALCQAERAEECEACETNRILFDDQKTAYHSLTRELL